MEPRISLLTLAVDDLVRSVAFYEALGWTRANSEEHVAFFQLGPLVLCLYPRDSLARDMEVSPHGEGLAEITIAYNTRAKEDVVVALERFTSAPLPTSSGWRGRRWPRRLKRLERPFASSRKCWATSPTRHRVLRHRERAGPSGEDRRTGRRARRDCRGHRARLHQRCDGPRGPRRQADRQRAGGTQRADGATRGRRRPRAGASRVDTFAARRRIGDAAISRTRYPFNPSA